ncbi:type I restriction-modification system subunit M N-terminal domain-containing protein [Candidatus Villigracilis affinis]|uniref:type I restriction-modification system subunit M N-terminal domain-containing protein n=1 Tax=Candidatus Villigracilis affinis TaxID=3140682 RepID=UPI0031E8F405
MAIEDFKSAWGRACGSRSKLRTLLNVGWPNDRPPDPTRTRSYLWGARSSCAGLVDAGDYKQYIFPLLFYKRLSMCGTDCAEAFAETEDKDYAEQMANEVCHPAQSALERCAREGSDVGKAIQNAFRAIEAANPTN